MSNNADDKINTDRKAAEIGSNVFKGSVPNACRFDIKFNTSKSTAVGIVDKAAKSTKAKPKAWVRYDRPHPGADFNHINVDRGISRKFHGLKNPPNHIPISGTHLAVVEKTTRVLDGINKVALPVAIAADTIAVGSSIYEDVRNGSSRNTVTSVATVAGGWGAGYGGAVGGAALGTAILPGVGTLLGGLFGGIMGGIGGSIGAGAVVDAIGDATNYDVQERTCKKCGRRFKAHLYNGEKDIYECENCRHHT